jgi:hypothetical protein
MDYLKNKVFFRKIISFILCFLLCLIMFLFNVLLIFQFTIGNTSNIIGTLASSNYYKYLTQEVRTKMYDYSDICGIPHNVFDNVITESMVAKDSYQYFKNCFTNKQDYLNSSLLAKDLNYKVLEYFKTIDTSQTSPEQLNENVTVFVEQCVVYYKDAISIPYLPVIGGMVAKNSQFINIAILILLLFFSIGILCLYLIQSQVHRFWRYIVYTLNGSALMLIVIPIYIFGNRIISRVSLNQKSIYFLVNSLFTNMFYCYLWTVLALFILAVLSMVTCIHFKNKYSYKNN